MTLHLYANIVTPFGTAANNRGDSEGSKNTPLQKLIWQGEPHTSVSAEAIRFALRRQLHEVDGDSANRYWNEQTQQNEWDSWKNNRVSFEKWWQYADDDLLGFMSAEAASEESTSGKGTTEARRAVLEITRAISLTPWPGDVVFNVASPNATPAAAKSKADPVPYTTEVHATRYQYGLAMTPARLREPNRAATALRCLGALGTVAGNQARFLFDFSPESIVLRLTDDPAPRMLYCFQADDDQQQVGLDSSFKNRVGNNGADIRADELIIGGEIAATEEAKALKEKGASLFPHQIKAAVEEACRQIEAHSDGKGA